MSGPNQVLDTALQLAGWSKKETARRVNAAAHQLGHPQVAVQGARVGRWISQGAQPREPVPQILADLLSTELNAELTPEDLHLRGHQTPAAGPAVLTVLFTASELDMVLQAAHRAGQSLAQYVRTAASTAARRDAAPARRPAVSA